MKISELKNAPEWLVLARTENADVELHPDYGYVIWQGGVWQGGVSVPRCKWYYGFENPNFIKIGCEKRTVEKWDKFFAGTEVISTPRGADEFKMIQACFEATKAYMNFMKL